VRRFERRGCR